MSAFEAWGVITIITAPGSLAAPHRPSPRRVDMGMHKLALVAATAAVSAGGAFALDAAVSSAGNHNRARLARIGQRVVHAELVVARGDGTFPTITIDRGMIAG
ncbi:MAG: hypothetical protein ACXVDD_16860, partial [Polyangia bacterium]